MTTSPAAPRTEAERLLEKASPAFAKPLPG
jgi:hypothetical protein